MGIKIRKNELILKDKNIVGFYKANITKFGNGAKIGCKKEFLEKGLKVWVVLCYD